MIRRDGTLALTAAAGAAVGAPAAGRVVFAGPYRGFGTIVIVEHPGGWTSLIAGLAAAEVATGQSVAAGSPIGRAPRAPTALTIELRRGTAQVPLGALLPPAGRR